MLLKSNDPVADFEMLNNEIAKWDGAAGDNAGRGCQQN
jgi:ribosome-binding ATPase YchF (GTP1/OBG family)